MSADPEFVIETPAKRGLLLPFAIVAALILLAGGWLVATRARPSREGGEIESPGLGCRFRYPAGLVAGPNFVRNSAGSFLTIERHSLHNAKKDFVAGLPDVLFPQVRIQLDQNYRDLEELTRAPIGIEGRRGLEVRLAGKAGKSSSITIVTVDIVATQEWVYVLRSYSPEARDADERKLFDAVRSSLRFDAAPADAAPVPAPAAS